MVRLFPTGSCKERVRSVGKQETKLSEGPDTEGPADEPKAIVGLGDQGGGKPAVEPFFF